MDHFKFQQEIIKWLLGEFREGPAQPGRISLLRTVRLTARHFIEYIPEKRRLRCSVCTGKKSRFSGSRVRTGVLIVVQDYVQDNALESITPHLFQFYFAQIQNNITMQHIHQGWQDPFQDTDILLFLSFAQIRECYSDYM